MDEKNFDSSKQFISSSKVSQQSNLLQRNMSKEEDEDEDEENKYLHHFMIIVSLSIQLFFECVAGILRKLGSKLEDFLNNNISLRKKPKLMREDEDFITLIGHIDTRTKLNKDIKHGDARYYPALSMMASKLAYENEIFIKTIVSHHLQMEFVKFYNCYNASYKSAITQAFIMREKSSEDGKIIVAFRGTEFSDAYDWCTDFDYTWCKVEGIKGRVHKGFMMALGLPNFTPEDGDALGDYLGIFPNKQNKQSSERLLAYYAIRDKLKEIMAIHKRAKLIVTGHSLGGALASLFPALLALHEEVDLLNSLEAIYTFGQPRVGDEFFGEYMKNILREHNIEYYRIVYGCDIAPSLPFNNTATTFKHFGRSIHFNSLYHAKIVEEEQASAQELRVKTLIKLIIRCILGRMIAVWELIRGFMIGFTAGPYYTEGWVLTIIRIISIIFTEFGNHNPQDYLNATLLASQDLFEYYPQLTS